MFDFSHPLFDAGERAASACLLGNDTEPALHGALRYAGPPSHRTHAPMGAVGRIGLQRGVDDFSDAFVTVASGSPGTQFIVQALDALLEIAFTPFSDGGIAQAHAFDDGCVGFSDGTSEHNLRALHQAVGKRAGIGEALLSKLWRLN